MTTSQLQREIVEFYNKRGAKERIFDDLNNSFGWNRLPKSFMNENTVFLLIMAAPDTNFYQLLVKGQRAEIFRPQTYESSRMKDFQIYISTRKVDKNGKTVCTKYLHRAECVCDCLQI